MKIKICGIKELEEVEIINDFKLNYAGFIFSDSKRKISLAKGRILIENLRKDLLPVGVFVNEDISFVLRAVEICKVKIVQLHGDESPRYIRKLRGSLKSKNIKIWKVIHVEERFFVKKLEKYKMADGILFETMKKGAYGGTGETFDWNIIKDIKLDQKKILAGGINSENIKKAINISKADVIDVNSGVETNLIKDRKKIKLLFENIN
ncbi:phosphoribosylanthranilate isomerase [Fusobacterium sp. MFO224]|uniref:phosphoribosylanthranilate isomerase n=1 Tax=Fusobacterium sp. MFO224 TaxID=3378070 RepID=UPI0038547FED